MRHYVFRRRRRVSSPRGNVVIHVPSTIGGTVAAGGATLVVIVSPSIFAGGSASSNIEAQDKDRTVNVGHKVGTFFLDLAIRVTTADGAIEFCVAKDERSEATPVLSTFPMPSPAEISTQGMQQVMRLNNPGKVFHFSTRAYSADNTFTHRIRITPAKFKLAKIKAGDHWVLLMFNRGSAIVTFDYHGRFKEFE